MTLLRFYPGWWRQSTHKKNLLHVVGYLVVVGYLIESRKSRHGGQAEGRKEGHPLENYIIYSCIQLYYTAEEYNSDKCQPYMVVLLCRRQHQK